jgi:hypothetical protein
LATTLVKNTVVFDGCIMAFDAPHHQQHLSRRLSWFTMRLLVAQRHTTTLRLSQIGPVIHEQIWYYLWHNH